MKIQFGCGSNILDGWNNHDAEVDITKPLPYGDGVADMVLAEHVSEHVTGPEVLRFFTEVHRILKPGGVFRVCVPAIGSNLERDHARDLILGHGHLVFFNREMLAAVLWAAGFGILNIAATGRSEIDGHWRVIGIEKDNVETLRMEATK